jgi:ABC-type polysaccharide/polyol phosphate transport system ATPase subunit
MVTSGPPALPDEVALSVEDLAKRQTNVHELRYAPTVSLVARLRSRRDGVLQPSSGREADDDELDEEDEDEQESEVEREIESEWPLRGISFTVARGDAVGVVGDRDSVAALVRVLVRMTAPTSGRVVHRGRIGLTSEFARVLARRELAQPRVALRILAALAGVPRRLRKPWTRAAIALITGDSTGRLWNGNAKEMHTRLPIAVSLEPYADILVVDRFPTRAEGAFFERCAERLRQQVANGAAAVVACSDVNVIAELCTSAVWLEDGTVACSGPAPQIVEDLRQTLREAKRGSAVALRAFNADVAIISAEVTTADGHVTHSLRPESDLRVVVRFETAHPDTSVTWRVRLAGPTTTSIEQRTPTVLDSPGAYLATLRLPRGSYDEGNYEIAVEAAVDRAGQRSAVMRTLRGRFRAEGGFDAESALFDPGSLAAEWTLLEESGRSSA